MAKLLFSNKAVEDLTNIWNYTVEMWSEAQADKYYAQLVGSCREIADSTRPSGREYAEIMAGLFGYRTDKHIVFYRSLSEDAVEIIRILHERMDLKTRIGD
jgi:plasmid stabilization system protein